MEKNPALDVILVQDFVVKAHAGLNGVKELLAQEPEAINILGPHGIPLIAHAQAGGNEALQVYEYLKSLASQNMEARV